MAYLTAPGSADQLNRPVFQPISRQKTANPRFGCRLFVHMVAEPYPQQDSFIRQCLISGQNSLRKQSKARPEVPDETRSYTWEQLVAGGLRLGSYQPEGMQDDGWGIATFDASGPQIRKSHLPAWQDKQYNQTVSETARRKPPVLLAHLREGRNSILENAHPFRLGKIAFMHNGTIPGHTLTRLEDRVTDYHQRYGIPFPSGETDTERAFLYMMGKLREKTSTLDPDGIPTEQLRAVFADVTREIKSMIARYDNPFSSSLSPRIASQTGAVIDPASRVAFPYALNFVLSDGNRILASRSGRQLHLGVRKGPDGKVQDMMLATRRMQPGPRSGQAPIEWWEIPEDHLVTLERRNGTIHLRLDPI